MKTLVNSLHPLERKVVPHLMDGITFEELIEASGLKDIEVMRALQWLSNREVLEIKEKIIEGVILTEKGKESSKTYFPEARLLIGLEDGGKKSLEEINDSLEKTSEYKPLSQQESGIAIGLARKNKFIEIFKENNVTKFSITKAGINSLKTNEINKLRDFIKRIKDNFIDLNFIDVQEKNLIIEALERGLITKDVKKKKTIHLKKLGQDLAKLDLSGKDVVDRITSSLIKEGSWKGKDFRAYDVKINVPKINYGKRHFVNQAVGYMKRIWLDLGFVEMQGGFVQTAFKDLDCLFVPQDHPARAMQDTFYIKDPRKGKLPSWYVNVKEVHENGADTGSKGWGGVWSKELAEENLLRTHTTVLSAEYLKKIKDGEIKMPAKFFSVNKVFRNESLDWKHLFEFNQVEGIVVDPNASVKHLKGYLREFFGKMGYTDVRMRPAHFPYTEPSFEVDVYNPKRKTWVELGGAGIFRPEVTKTLIGVEVPVLAWGIGMERIITEYYEINDLRDLYKNDLKQSRRMKAWMK